MGWRKVCGAARSGILVLKCNARTRMLAANLDHLRVGWRPRGSYETAWVSDHKLMTPSGMGLVVCGAGSHSSCHPGVPEGMCQRG